ncbi:MAG: META domain-containing protein [Marinobacter sp.]|nr:META domain-containing protein [Marinobacter sp.]
MQCLRTLRAACLLTVALSLVACASLMPEKPSSNTYSCGQLDIRVAETDAGLLGIDFADQRLLLKSAESASGALYVAPDNPDTRFWSKGARASLTVDGERYPECLEPGAIEDPFEARGNEPFWRVRVAAGQLTLERPYESTPPLRLDAQLEQSDRHGRTFVAEGSGVRVKLRVARQLCNDSMSGSQYPAQARLTINGDVYQGCGGDPVRLLRGVEWVVETVDGLAVMERSQMTVRFLDGQRVVGAASCNRYAGTYRLTGEGLDVDSIASTRMACVPSLMKQEERFLKLLGQIRAFRIGKHGELNLLTLDGRTIVAHRNSGGSIP